MSDLLEIKGLSHSFLVDHHELLVLDQIDLTVKEGEFLTLIGPSGCGKSTFLKLITGFIKPERGQILLKNEQITGPDANRIIVFQDFNQLFPWKTVLQNVLFPLEVKKLGTSKERLQLARRYLNRVQLADFLDFYPHQLSGGMKQRVALARALVAGPEILLMDEPFGSLDSQTRGALQNLLLEIWQELKSTVIFVTHDVREALALADRIVVMDKAPGKIKQIVVNPMVRPRNLLNRQFAECYQMINLLL